jgi:diacylglycerol kinase family enzyme/molybdopterin converting factor small subunit
MGVAVARVRLFAALREMAGTTHLDVPGATVDEIVQTLTEKFGTRFGEIARAGSALVDKEAVAWETPLGDDDEVALLPPVAGGSVFMPRRPERVLLLVNPVARTVSRPVLDVIEKALAADFKLDVNETNARDHATELAQEAVDQGSDLVVVFSGDGTINEVLGALAGTDVGLGIIPGGATNVLARVLGVPTDPVEATAAVLHHALDGSRRKLHLGTANDRFFAFACGIGLDASAMGRLEEREISNRRFPWAGMYSVIREAFVHYAGREADLTVRVESGPPVEAVSVMVGRTNPYTFFKRWGVKVTPKAEPSGGLDVLTVKNLTRRSIGRLGWQVLVSGTVFKRRNVEYAHDVSSVEVVGRNPFPLQLDGDYVGLRDRVSIGLARDAIWVYA